ncbi:MAG: hypothetical protein HY074_19725 [Deltaproteobacteria bacterium]|nr:hypothetical protein [Deltaproteobacteria bacterium]
MTTTRTSLELLVGVLLLVAGCTSKREISAPTENALRIPLEAKVTSLDPHRTTDAYSSVSQSVAYESLFQFHYLKVPMTPVPALAESMPVFSKDRKTLTIKLKKGVHFQDDPCFTSTGGKGPEFTAADVIYFFERIAEPKLASPVFGTFEHKVVGIDEFHAGKAKTVAGVRALDPYTVEVRTVVPMPRFALDFTDTHGAILSKECVQNLGERINTYAVGTGPFKITEANLGSKIVAVRNPTFRHDTYPNEGSAEDRKNGLLDDAGKTVPFVDKITFEIFAERQPMWLKFKAGQLNHSKIPKDFIPTELAGGKPSAELAALGVQHYKRAKGDVTVNIFNMDDPIWGKNKKLRQAVALAMDVPQIIALGYSGQAIRAQSMVDPTQYGYDTNFHSRWSTRDVAKAKQLMAEAGYPDGKGLPPIDFPSADGTTQRQFNEMTERQLAEIGVTLKTDMLTWPEYDARMRQKQFQMTMMGEASSVPDIDDSTQLWHSRNAAPGPNSASYRNPVVDSLVEKIEALDNGPERMAVIAKAKAIMDDDLPYVALVHRIGNQFFQKWVKNTTFIDDLFIGCFAKYLRVETATAKK